MQKLIQALAKNNVTVRNVTQGEISLHYPELDANNYPTGLLLRIHIPAGKTLTLTQDISIHALKLSQSLKNLVKARHLRVIS